ncbi:MAG: serine/threonine-protein kinase, partial [Acidobacteriota bacterium]
MAELDWKRVRELFDEAAELAPAERSDWLVRVCGGDAALRAKVEQLLQAGDEAGRFIETPALALLEDQPTREWMGQRVGPYQVVRELGRGGMGVVYLAERADGEFDKQVAIKLLPSGADAQARQRFRRERQILADLEHPNIARLLDGGTLDEQPYVVMEFVPGQSLRERLRARGALPLAEINTIVQQVCAGLAAAHGHGVIHRDIKPENLIVAYPGGDGGQPEVKILDFGIAKLQQQATTEQTQTAVILGTVRYMSPEQAAGAGLAEVDARADLYSLGVVIYEMLTGAPAFAGDSYASVLAQHLYVKPMPPHEAHPELAIPHAVSDVVVKALAKAPAARQQSAGQLAEEFARAFHLKAARKPVRQWRALALSAVVGLALFCGVWAAVAWSRRPAVISPLTLQPDQAAAVAASQLQYRIFKKTGAESESVMQSP